jgi:flagellar hook-length control protein FliK
MPVSRVADPVGVQAGKAGELPEVPVRIAKDSPEMAWRAVQDSPATGRRAVAKSTQPEQVQIIAPAPLPIELPAAAVRQQPVSAAPSAIAHMFVAAAEAVADAILVSSGFANGEGRIIVRLQPEVLNGSEVQIAAKDGKLTVVVNPATQDVQNIVEANRTQFEQHLAEKVHAWRVSVAVKRGDKSDERV